MKTLSHVTGLVAAFGLLFCGCEKSPSPIGNSLSEQNGQSIPSRASALKTAETIPSPLVTLNVGGSALEFWPFTGVDFSGTPQDPINLIFAGQTDPRALRAALLFLDGNRTAFGFPNAFPFNLTWQDAIGGVQTAFANPEGWAGSAIQLALGPYDPVRFHVRLFEVGDFALGGAHFEVLIPGTTDHQVISWELAEQLIVADFARSNLLAAAPASSGSINPSPFKDIPAIIYNGLPVELRAAIGGPLGDVSSPVPIATDGQATILALQPSSAAAGPVVATQEFVINFDQIIPKPFCASSLSDLILVQGPVTLRQQVIFTRSGNFISQFHAVGHLEVTPLDATTGQPAGETYRARVNEHHKGIVTDAVTLASSFQMFVEIPPSGPFRGRLKVQLQVGPGRSNQSSIAVDCLP